MCTLTGGRQAVNELQVFLRTISGTQRLWAKRIAAQEAKVRRCMILEDHCRKKLRKSVLRLTNEQLKRLVDTDPLGTMMVKLPPRSAFNTLHIPTNQVTGFAVFAMARLHASPASLTDVPQMGLIADLLGAWEILPPPTKERYEAFAKSIRGQDTTRRSRNKHREVPTTMPNADNNSVWEIRAFNRFLCLGRRQLEETVGPLQDHEWPSIAPREWDSLTLRQKKSYLSE